MTSFRRFMEHRARPVCARGLLAGQLLVALSLLTACATTAPPESPARTRDFVYPAASWQELARPEDAGWSSAGLARARAFADSIASAAVMIVHRGMLVDEWGETARRFNSHSIRKSLLSALYGIYVAQGRIAVDATMAELGIDDHQPLTPTEKQARVIDLLRARSGVYHPALYETAAMAAARPPRGSHAPGTFWYYNNWDFNVLGTIFEQRTGRRIGDAFLERIAGPLQMQDFRPGDVQYVTGDVSRHAAYPFRITARDLARFGLLYLSGGSWRGQQIVPADWVAKSTTATERAGSGAYEYLWWLEFDGNHFANVDLGGGSYSARGSGGHVIAVIPAHDLVVVHRVNTDEPGNAIPYGTVGRLLALILAARTASVAG